MVGFSFQHKNESMVFEVSISRNDAVNALNHLEEWTKPEKVRNLLRHKSFRYEFLKFLLKN